MMVSLMEGIDTILIVFSDKGICLSTPVPISLPSWSMTDVVSVKPHIPCNKKELSQYRRQPSLTGLLTPKRLKISDAQETEHICAELDARTSATDHE
jgi:hypothetical protein